MKIIGGSASKVLTEDICNFISHIVGERIDPVKTFLGKFNNGETQVEIHENLRGEDVYVIQLFSGDVNDDLMELMLLLDTLRRSDVHNITVILPLYPYSRQDKKSKSRTPISAKVMADVLQLYNIKRLITLDLHAPQIQGFFSVPVDNLYGSILFLPYMRKFNNGLCVISPDAGGNERATHYAKNLECEMGFCYKYRDKNKPGEIETMKLIGSVQGKDCVIVDDIIDSGGTLVKSADILKENGAISVNAFATHGVFSNDAIDKLTNSQIDNIFVTDSISPNEKLLRNNKFNIVSIAPMLSQTIDRLTKGFSLSEMFE